MMAPSPMVTPLQMRLLVPMKTLLPMTIGAFFTLSRVSALLVRIAGSVEWKLVSKI